MLTNFVELIIVGCAEYPSTPFSGNVLVVQFGRSVSAGLGTDDFKQTDLNNSHSHLAEYLVEDTASVGIFLFICREPTNQGSSIS